MKKNQFIFGFLISIYLIFIWKADLYSNFEIKTEFQTCCQESKEEKECCGIELNDGHCQSNSCCHVSSSLTSTSIRLEENNLEIQAKFKPLKPFLSKYFINILTDNFNLKILKSLGTKLILVQTPPWRTSSFLSFISTWLC